MSNITKTNTRMLEGNLPDFDRVAGNLSISRVTGAIPNSKLENNSITINGTSVSLGGSANITANLGTGGATNSPVFIAYRSGTQSIAGHTWETILHNSEDADTPDYYDGTTGRFTPESAGYYQVNVNALVRDGKDSSANVANFDVALVAIFKNTETDPRAASQLNQISVSGVDQLEKYGANVTTVVYLNGSTDYIESRVRVEGLSTTVATANIHGERQYTNFSAFKLADGSGNTNTEGPAGSDGTDGTDGATGPAGADGQDGQDGQDGADGPQGLQGPQGIQGEDGATGPAGPVGPKGSEGGVGQTGSAGSAGAEGPAGPTGPAGATGSQGERGPTGPQGGDNTNITIFGKLAESSTYSTNSPTGVAVDLSELYDPDSKGSISNNVMTMPSGTYLVGFTGEFQKTGSGIAGIVLIVDGEKLNPFTQGTNNNGGPENILLGELLPAGNQGTSFVTRSLAGTFITKTSTFTSSMQITDEGGSFGASIGVKTKNLRITFLKLA